MFTMTIGVIIITYNPNIKLLEETVLSIDKQVNEVLFVDNGSENIDDIKMRFSDLRNGTVIDLHKNMGIAYATNVGFDFFIKKEYDYIILSDQDSIFAPNYITTFYEALFAVSLDNIAAFAPSIYDVISNQYRRFYYKRRIWIKQSYPTTLYSIVFQAIASGLIISVSRLKTIGYMNENLFIDSVDFEWCWKLNFSGYRIIGCKNLVLQHTLGDRTCIIGHKKITIHNNIRCYYITRNTIYLSLHTKFLSVPDRFILFCKGCVYPALFSVCSDTKITTLKYCISGFWDGFGGRLGKYIHSIN